MTKQNKNIKELKGKNLSGKDYIDLSLFLTTTKVLYLKHLNI
jgi:hypothetical protein